MSNFLQRTLTTIIGGALMVVLILLGREFLLGVLLFASVVGYYELSGAFGVRKSDQKINAMSCIGYISVFAWYALLEIRSLSIINSETFSLIEVCGIILMLMAHMSVYVFKYPEYDASRTISSFFSVIYCPVMLSFVYMIRSLEKGVHRLGVRRGAEVCQQRGCVREQAETREDVQMQRVVGAADEEEQVSALAVLGAEEYRAYCASER